MSADRESRSLQRDSEASDPMADHKRRARWRLLGALVITGIVAAIAPLLLEEQARPLSQDLLIEIPSRNSQFSKIDSLKSAASEAAPEKSPEPAKTEPQKAEPVKVEAKTPEAKKPEAKAAEPKKAPETGYLVQVGAYAKLEAANAVKTKLTAGGHRVIVETIKVEDGSERHRVRIGPFETRELASQIRERAKSQGYDAIVVTP